MSDAKNAPETIADICREMRSKIDCLATDPGYNRIHCRSAAEWARRIEAAAKRVICTDNSETLRNALARVDEFGDALSRTIEERDRLSAALKPVMECATKSAEGSMPNYMGCWDAVREAQRIYKEGANND